MMIERFDDVENRPLLGLRKGPDGRFRSAEELDDIDDLRRAFRRERESRGGWTLFAVAIGLVVAAILIMGV